MTWQPGGTVGDRSCENRPDGFFCLCRRNGESRVGWHLGLPPGVDARRQESKEILRGAALIGWLDLNQDSGLERKQNLSSHGTEVMD